MDGSPNMRCMASVKKAKKRPPAKKAAPAKKTAKTKPAFSFRFPATVAVPPILAALASFAVPLKDWFSGHFELCADDASGWLDDAEAAKSVAVFGQEGDGSLYALWLRAGRSPEASPVIYLNSENDGNQIVAGSLRDFLALLALDIDELGFWVSPGSWARAALKKREGERSKHAADYRKWLARQRIVPAETAEDAQRLTKLPPKDRAAFKSWLAAAQRGHEEPLPAPAASAKPSGTAYLAFELIATPDAYQAGLATFVRALAGRDAKLTVASQSRLKSQLGPRPEETEKTGRLPPDFSTLSEHRITFKKDGKQHFCVVSNPRRKHIEATLAMYEHPDNDLACAAARSLFEGSVGKAGTVKVRRGNGA